MCAVCSFNHLRISQWRHSAQPVHSIWCYVSWFLSTNKEGPEFNPRSPEKIRRSKNTPSLTSKGKALLNMFIKKSSLVGCCGTRLYSSYLWCAGRIVSLRSAWATVRELFSNTNKHPTRQARFRVCKQLALAEVCLSGNLYARARPMDLFPATQSGQTGNLTYLVEIGHSGQDLAFSLSLVLA